MDEDFLKWHNYHQKYLKNLYKMTLKTMKSSAYLITKAHHYTSFCYLMYNKSSKRIPLY